MSPEKMVENLWSLANGITSFAVVQALGFLYALGGAEFKDAISNYIAQIIIVFATIVFTYAYSYGVWKCWDLASAVQSDHKVAWQTATTGRIVCIVMFNLMVLGVNLAIYQT